MKDERNIKPSELLETADSASAYAEARLEEVRSEYQKRKIKLMKISGMMILTSIMLIFATRSWFTMSRSVEGTNANMTAAALPYEIEVRGTKIENQDIFSKVDNSYVSGVQQKDSEGTLISYYQTTGDETHETILWNKDSTADGSYPNGLEPNAHGTLSFWVIPKETGELNVNFSFGVRGFHAKYSQDEEHSLINTIEINSLLDSMTAAQLAEYNLTSDKLPTKKKALEYINGHIMFFKNYDNGHYSGFLGNGGNTIAFKDCLPDGTNNVTAGQKYHVTIYWKWANTLEQAVSYSDTPLLDDTASTFSEDQTAILSYLADYTNHKIFDGVTDSDIAANIAKLQNSDTSDDKAALTALTDKYNNADEIIGNNIYYILIEMTASTT